MSDLIDRQAAIEALNKLSESTYEVNYGVVDCDDAIGEIEQLPPAQPDVPDINVGDTISRAKAIDAINRIECTRYTTWYEFYQKAITAVNELPPAQPERIRGRWVLDRSGAYCCSECMEPCAGYVMMKPRDKFCKMCGAKMEVTT